MTQYGNHSKDVGPADNHVRQADRAGHDWRLQRVGKRVRVVCRECGRFYGYLPANLGKNFLKMRN